MNPKVSLIIPVYNVEKYLKKCLDSATSQTLKNIEIIIINDGSTDSSLEISKDYAKIDNRIKLFSQKNLGQGYARNFGIKKAKGVFIFCLDADDWIETNTLELLYETTIKESSDVVICGWQRIDENNRNVIQVRKDIHSLEKLNKDSINKYIFSAKINLMACACLIKKSIIDDNYIIYPNIYHEDLYVMPKVYYYAQKISIVKDNLYNWLVRSNSTTNSFSMKHAIGLGGVPNDWKLFLLKEGIFEKYKNDFIQGTIVYLNLYIHRVHKFALEEEKKSLLTYLEDVLMGIHELKDYKKVLPAKDLKAKQSILNFYDNILINLNCNQNIQNDIKTSLQSKQYSLEQQLNRIRKSRGYKLLLIGYRLQDKIIPLHSKRRKALKVLFGKEKFKNIFRLSLNKTNMKFDIVFMPHKDYHVWTMGLIAKKLLDNDISSCMIDLTDHYRDEGARDKAKDFPNIPFIDYSFLRDDKIEFDTIICMNDWDKKYVRPEIIKAKNNNKKTIGIVEGIQDFFDLDTKQDRKTYKTVEYVLLTGEHDRQFFEDCGNKTHIIGVPRLASLLEEDVIFPKKQLAVINVNFSYNVLADKAEEWLESTIKGCKKANIDYIITQHPADKTNLKNYKVSSLNMYDTIRNGSIIISRFSSTILEALAMGKPVVYHNPHDEKAIKFQNPLNAYSLSFDSDSLAKAIKYELSLHLDYRERANNFLDFHCNINSKKSSVNIAAREIENILRAKQ